MANQKTILYFLFFVLFFNYVRGFLCTQAMYQDYLNHWKRNFTHQKLSPQYSSKFSTYCANKQHIDSVNTQNLSYKLNQYWEWMNKNQQQRAQIVRIQLSPEKIAATAQATDYSTLRKVGQVPTSKDWRSTNDVSSIKNQGSCGACWAFTVVGLYESWMMVKGEKQYDLSEQYILECTTKFTQNILKINLSSTCGGGYVDFSGQLARLNGVPSQSAFPYTSQSYVGSTFPNTNGICSANVTYMYNANPLVTTFTVSYNNSNSKMKELISAAPVGALIYANSEFQAYSSGIYTGCPSSFTQSRSKINHAVIIVGYDSSGNYIVKNSWGTSWGQNGFGIVSKDADCALSYSVYQYNSLAPPGGSLLYYNQIKLEGANLGKISIGLSLSLVLMMILMTI